MTDNIDGLMSDLYWLGSGWHRVVNPETGAMALFPETATSEAEWEQRALAMHAAQTPIHLEAKPLVNELAARVVRGD